MTNTWTSKNTAKERFENKFVKEPSGCWRWTACFQGTGYGYFWLDGRLTTAPRAALKLYKELDAGKQFACHTCDNRWCVNPDHLFLGSAQDNMDDCVVKKRFRPGNHGGTRNGRAKLTDQDVTTIRQLAAIGISRKQILQQFDIGTSQYHRIVNKVQWNMEENA